MYHLILAMVVIIATIGTLALIGQDSPRTAYSAAVAAVVAATVLVPTYDKGAVLYSVVVGGVVGGVVWVAVQQARRPDAPPSVPGPTPSPQPNPSPRPAYPDVVDVRPGMPPSSVSIEMVTPAAAEMCGIPPHQIGRPAIIHRAYGAYRTVISPASPGWTPAWLERAARGYAEAWHAQYIDLTTTATEATR